MKLILIIVFLSLTPITHAEEYETGGGYEPPIWGGGGYDPKAAEKAAKKAAEEAMAKQAIENEKQTKIYRIKAAAEKKRRDKIATEKMRKELLPENMALLEVHEVCIKAGKSANSDSFKHWIAELNRRGIKFDEPSIRSRSIKIHGYECDVFAAYGLPNRYNRTVTVHGTSIQFVYKRDYVYTDNGIITAWSD